MRKVIDYTIIRSHLHTRLVTEVNELLQSGLWELYGTPYVTNNGDSVAHYQALVEYEVK